MGRRSPTASYRARIRAEKMPLTWANTVERVTGIEPALSAWEADVLPLDHTRRRLRRYLNPPYSGASGRQAKLAGRAPNRPVGGPCDERAIYGRLTTLDLGFEGVGDAPASVAGAVLI